MGIIDFIIYSSLPTEHVYLVPIPNEPVPINVILSKYVLLSKFILHSESSKLT